MVLLFHPSVFKVCKKRDKNGHFKTRTESAQNLWLIQMPLTFDTSKSKIHGFMNFEEKMSYAFSLILSNSNIEARHWEETLMPNEVDCF